MVAIEPGTIIGFDKLEPLFEVPGQGLPAVVEMVENPKPHPVTPRCYCGRNEATACRSSSNLRDCVVAVFPAMTFRSAGDHRIGDLFGSHQGRKVGVGARHRWKQR